VALLCGTVPAYRALHVGVKGRDVRLLNHNLHQLGYDTDAHVRIDPADSDFTSKTEQALRVLQRNKGVGVTGGLEIDDAVLLPVAVRITKVTGQVGGSARPGAPVLSATSDTLQVQVNLDPSQQGEVKKGDRAQITLPGNTPVTGRVAGFGRVAQTPAGQGSQAADATIPTFISLDDPAKAGVLDKGPGPGGHHHQGRGARPERPGHRAGRQVRRRVRRRGRARRRPTRAGRREARPVRHRRRTSPGRGRSSRRRFSGGAVNMSDAVLELEEVTKVYGEDPPVFALRGVSFSVRRGELVAIVGPSGSGKSTLLHVMGTLERPSSGVVRIGGIDAAGLSDREVSLLRAREIGFVFQQFFLAEHATVRENVADGMLYAGAPAAERYARADEALERVGLSHRATFKPTKLSGGERQRVATARALVGRPTIVLADEPTGNLDSATGASIMELIGELNAAGATIIMITHDAGLADQLPRQVRMLDGQVVSDTADDRSAPAAPVHVAATKGQTS
jgi:putative ABC transport system ATP-binding protein